MDLNIFNDEMKYYKLSFDFMILMDFFFIALVLMCCMEDNAIGIQRSNCVTENYLLGKLCLALQSC